MIERISMYDVGTLLSLSPLAPDYDKSQWISEKEKLGLDFPNVCSNVFLLSPPLP